MKPHLKSVKDTYLKIVNTYKNFHNSDTLLKYVINIKEFGYCNIYLIPKIHKQKLASRPIVNQRNFLLTKVYGAIHTHYSNKLNSNPESHKLICKGNNDLLNRLDILNIKCKNNTINLSKLSMLSIDVTNLYGNINLDEILRTVRTVYNYHNKEELMFYKLLNIVLKTTIIESENKLYLQRNGISMGARYSPSLANFYLYYNFDVLFKPLIDTNKVLFYVRYLDDILVIYDHSLINMDHFVTETLNKQHTSIQFTTEHTNDINSINFLDLTIQLNKQRNTIIYHNYGKPLNCNTMLHDLAFFTAKNGLIKSQFIRILKNSSIESWYLHDTQKLINQLIQRGYKKELIIKNVVKWSDRAEYMNPNRVKTNNFMDNLKDKMHVILPFHSKLKVINKWLRKKYPNLVITVKDYQNLHSIFFKNRKNTQLEFKIPKQ